MNNETIMSSILLYIAKVVGGLDEYESHFDPDLIMFINSAFSVLSQIGVGPEEPFKITGPDEQWSDFDYQDIEAVKEWMYLTVKLIFDPPQSATVTTAFENRKNELTWRMNVIAEEKKNEESDN